MKILLVNKFHYLKGGSEKYYFELGELLKENGHEVAFFSMEDEENILKSDLSSDVLGGFESLEYTLDMMEYENIYKKILSILPSNAISFEKFGLEKMIACEIICAAICHKINWDYLRQSIYERTLTNPKWLEINCLLNISANEIEELLQHYERKERIQAQERSRMIRTIVKQLKDLRYLYAKWYFKTICTNRKFFPSM